MVFFLMIIALIVALCMSLLLGGNIDFGLIISNVIGLLLLTACFTALGLYISSLTVQPAVAAIITLGGLLGLWLIDLAADGGNQWLQSISLLRHFERFNQGLIDTFSLVYFILFTATFLILTIRRLDSERLHG